MKKSILLLIACLLLSMTACGSTNKSDEEKAAVEVENKLLNKEITISKNFLDLAEVKDPQESIDSLVSEKKIKSGKVNEDGSITYIMSAAQHKKYMEDLKENIESSNQELIQDTSNSITDIKMNDPISVFDVYVDPNSYNDFESFMALGFYIQGGFYRMFNGDKDPYVTVNFINKDTGDILNTANSADVLKADSDASNAENIDPEVKITELPYAIKVLKPDSIGNIYGHATFTNNSKYPIKDFSLEGTIPSTNENTCFISTDTVMPGETSPIFESFYEQDTPINHISYTYVKDGQDVHVEYDAKLKSYSIF